MVEKKRKAKKKPLKKTDESDSECLARLKKQVSEDSTDEESEATRRAKSLADSPQAGLCRKGSQKNIGACVHTLELTRPFYSCVGLCACAFPNLDLDEWKKVFGMIPLMTPDDLDLFKGRLKKVDMTALRRRPPFSRRAAARTPRAPCRRATRRARRSCGRPPTTTTSTPSPRSRRWATRRRRP